MFDKPGVLINDREKLWVFADLVQKFEVEIKIGKKNSIRFVFFIC